MKYDAIIVGGGVAGLTTTAYLAEAGYKVLLCEKEQEIGGLVNSFNYKGFVFDGGIRSIESSGIVFPMLRQLGIDIDLVTSTVSLGLEKTLLPIDSKKSLSDYQTLLNQKFPDNQKDIAKIIKEIAKIMKYMDILYGIDNPLFMDFAKNKKYLFTTVIPWSLKFLFTINKINELNEPVYKYLNRFTDNKVLIDVIAQHFFKDTPTFFALSYFSLYMDYNYPKNGTGELPKKIEEFINNHNGEILKSTKVTKIDLENRVVVTNDNTSYEYKELVWTADLKALYNKVDLFMIKNKGLIDIVVNQKEFLKDKQGGDSVLTLYLTVNLDKSYFKKICTEHLFYTPMLKGLSQTPITEIIISNNSSKVIYNKNKEKVFEWMKKFLNYTTFEISIPALRNAKLAPEKQTGLIISTLIDHSLIKHINEMGWYDEFKELVKDETIAIMDSTIFPNLQVSVIDKFVSTPLTIEKRTGNSDGAITGWAFTNSVIPAVSNMTKVTQSVNTDLPHVLKAGQWSYSPSGLPISVMTGKIAANQVIKKLKVSK